MIAMTIITARTPVNRMTTSSCNWSGRYLISYVGKTSIRSKVGKSRTAATLPTIPILKMPLMNSTTCLPEKIRFAPVIGLNLLNFGCNAFGENQDQSTNFIRMQAYFRSVKVSSDLKIFLVQPKPEMVSAEVSGSRRKLTFFP